MYLIECNSNFLSMVLSIMFLLIDAERLPFSFLSIVLVRRSLVPLCFFLANCLYVYLGGGIIMEGDGGVYLIDA